MLFAPHGLNNPLRYTDPSGHRPCENGNCQINPLAYRITYGFGWILKGNDWTGKELQTMFVTGNRIKNYVDNITNGKGQQWMDKYLSGITFAHDFTLPNNQSYPAGTPFVPKGGITYLNGDWTDPSKNVGWDPHQLFAHELGHHWDCTSGGHVGLGCVGGAGDMLASFTGTKPGTVRFDLPGRLSFLSDPDIPAAYQWRPSIHGGYGNESTGEYLAEAFSWNIYNPTNLPQPAVGMWINTVISLQASALP